MHTLHPLTSAMSPPAWEQLTARMCCFSRYQGSKAAIPCKVMTVPSAGASHLDDVASWHIEQPRARWVTGETRLIFSAVRGSSR